MIRFFGRFGGLARKFHMAFLVTAIIPALVAGVVGIYYSLDALKKETLQHLDQEVTGRARSMAHFFDQLTSELLYLSRSATLYELVNQPDGRGAPLRRRLESDFAAFAKTYPYIYQVRFIDAGGSEVVRIDRRDERLLFVPDGELQQKRDRYYFQESISIEPGQVYVSPLDLNIEHGQIESPQRPVIRFATPVVDRHGKKQGVVIINLHAAYLLDQIEHLAGGRSGISYLFDRSGFFLSRSSDGTQRQAPDFMMESVETLTGHLPRELLTRILQGGQGTEVVGEWIAAFAPITPGSTLADRGDDVQSWAVGLIYPRARLLEAVFNLYLLYGVLALSLVASAAAGFILSRHLLRPLEELSNETEAIARGDFAHRIDVRGDDEIADLGQRFNVMAANLEQSYQALEDRKGELEREVRARTADLERERARLAAVIDNTADGIVAVDPEGRIELANQAAARILGSGQPALLGRELAELWPGWPEWLQQQPAAGPARLDLAVGDRLLSVNVAPMLESGQPLRHILVLRDVSEERRLQDHRRELDRQMFQMEKMTTLGEIAMGLAHEIGNPLAGMKTVAQLLLDEEIPDEQRHYLLRLLGEIDRLSAFLRTFHGFAAPQEMHPVACDIGQALDDVLLWTRKQAQNHRVDIVYAPCAGDVPQLWADPGQLKQVLLNLVINAIHAMPEGGRIEIGMCAGCGVSDDDAGPRRMRFCVRDNGPGIPESVVPRIFDPFFTTRADGSGLGLAVVKKIVSQHGAEIRVDTGPGRGTVFELDWPVAPDQPILAAAPAACPIQNQEFPRNV